MRQIWGVSSAGRASALQAGGHRFEPYTPHSTQKSEYGGIAQLARAHGSYPWCREFKSPFRYSREAGRSLIFYPSQKTISGAGNKTVYYNTDEEYMSRAFMKENDGMFHCSRMDRDCPEANLRGGCDLDRCRHEDAVINAPENRDKKSNEEIH